MLNQVVICGSVVEDVVLKETSTGILYANILMRVKREYRNSEGNYDSDTFSIVVWRSVAEQCVSMCKQNVNIAIKGRLQSNMYNREDGTTFYNYEIIAEKVFVMD